MIKLETYVEEDGEEAEENTDKEALTLVSAKVSEAKRMVCAARGRPRVVRAQMHFGVC